MRKWIREWWATGGDPMGKNAVGNVYLWMIWPITAAVIPNQTVSPSLVQAGGQQLEQIWGALTFAAVVIFGASYLPKLGQTKRVLEIYSLSLMALTNLFYILAIESTAALSSPLAQSLSGALATAAVSRAILLFRVHRMVKREGHSK